MGAIYFGLLFVTRNPDFRSTVDILLDKFRRGRPAPETVEPV
jgi:putative peptidoglycan lipid II flippase